MDEIKSYVELALNLEYNMLDSAVYILKKNDWFDKPSDTKIYFTMLSSFYELYFKYRLCKINKSLVWNNPERFDEDKHNKVDFKSKSAREVASLALNFSWINKSEWELIYEIIGVRDKLVHFSLCEQDSDGKSWRCMSLSMDLFDNTNKNIIKKLLLDIDGELKDNKYYIELKRNNFYA